MAQSADRTSERISPEIVGGILVSEGEVTQEQLDEAWEICGENGRGLGEILISQGHTTAEGLSRTLTRRLEIEYVVLSEEKIDPDLINLVQHDVLIDFGVVPLRIQGGSLVVAMKYPVDEEARSRVAQSAGQPIIAVAASEDAIRNVQERFLGSSIGTSGAGQPKSQQASARGSRSGRSAALGSGRIGDILISQGKITPEQLEYALEVQNETSKNLGEALLSLGYIEPEDLAQALARRLRLDFVIISELSEDEVDNEALDMMEEKTLRKYKALPIRFEENKLVVAMSDPNDLYALEDLRMIAGRPITPVVVTEEDLEGALDHLYGADESYYGEEAEYVEGDDSSTTDPGLLANEGGLADAELDEYSEQSADPQDVEEIAGTEDKVSETAPDRDLYQGLEESEQPPETDEVAEAPTAADYQVEPEEERPIEEHFTELDLSEDRPTAPRRVRGALSGRGKMGEILISRGNISEEQLRQATEIQREDRRELGEILLSLGYVTTTDLAQAMAQRLKLDFMELTENEVDRGLLTLIDQRILRKHGVMPVRVEDGKLFVAMSDPKDLYALEDLRMISGYPVTPVVTTEQDIRRVQGKLFAIGEGVSEFLEEAASEEFHDEQGDVLLGEGAGADEAPIIRLVSSILQQAVGDGASDIHIEPQSKEVKVRFRVDGVLREVMSIPQKLRSGVIARLKVIADLNIAERRIPQDGRFSVRLNNGKIDLRVVTLPTAYGEKVVLRLLDTANVEADLTKLGFSEEYFASYEKIFNRPYGAILVTGPTGSGKSTTLYATLNELNSSGRNIITVEDPVEYRIPGLNQIQVNPRAGLTFATGLRSILRADPDVIMIGEIRDVETAKISVESSLTGHMVLATLHTNNAPGALTRLTEMGVEPFLTSSAVDCVIAQRLCRRLCERCKQPTELDREYLEQADFPFDLVPEEEMNFFKPVGCDRCGGTGYKGRLGLYELMVVTEPLRDLVIRRASTSEMSRTAVDEGMIPLRADGMIKAARGATTVEEVLRTVV